MVVNSDLNGLPGHNKGLPSLILENTFISTIFKRIFGFGFGMSNANGNQNQIQIPPQQQQLANKRQQEYANLKQRGGVRALAWNCYEQRFALAQDDDSIRFYDLRGSASSSSSSSGMGSYY